MQVVIYSRASTNRQEYDRQVHELRELANGRGWQVVGEFAEKVSGAKKNEERPELMKMLDFIGKNQVDKVLVWEFSRLGRNTLQVLETIEQLNEQKVSVYIKNYGMETLDDNGNENIVNKLMVKILADVANMERNTIKERVKTGYENHLKNGGRVGRKPGYRKPEEKLLEQYSEVVRYLKKGYSYREIAKLTGTSVNTIGKVNRIINPGTEENTDHNP